MMLSTVSIFILCNVLYFLHKHCLLLFMKIAPIIATNMNAHQNVNFRYCNQYVDKDALIYLILANEMLHDLHPDIITIAEDVSFFSLTCIYFHINILLGLRYAVW